MKAVFISYNQALTDRVQTILDRESIRGYSKWETTYGRGSYGGDPHMGSHAWPAMNSSILAMVDDSLVEPLMAQLRNLDNETEHQGLRAFVWNVEGVM
ncbi:MAG: hypothetical protein LBK47_03415 [Prevotellaceae bacterium]|jgi:hypothetical protein|nr:hypothetical protein [Prevotellaceae bacterium]